MKKAISALSALLALVLSSCATFRFEPLPSEGVTVKTNRGQLYPVYDSNSFEVIVKPEFRGGEVMYKISVYNKTDGSVLVSDEDFTVQSSPDMKKWEPVRTYTSDEYYAKEKSEYIAGAVLLAVATIGSELDYVYTHTTTTTVYTYNYGVYHRYRIKTVRVDPVGREYALYHNFELISDYAHEGRHWLKLLENNLFYEADIEPDSEYFGLIFSKQSDDEYYRVRIRNPEIKCDFYFQIVEE